MKTITLIASGFLFLTINIHAQQEKRLALVIGNANYKHYSKLKNPINDAELIAKTLSELGFEVMQGYNLGTKDEMENIITEFGKKRDTFDVAFVYYAGHAIQINNLNYLMPTNEVIDFDFLEYELKKKLITIQDIIYWLERKSHQVNIFVLDACRNNPIPDGSRSIGSKDGGLARIEAPSGTLIAFAAEAGYTAADGDGKNSVYAASLAKNIMLENTTLSQVFRNIRAEVEHITNNQRPDITDKRNGAAFYLKKSTYTDKIILIDSLIEAGDLHTGLEKSISILTVDKNNKSALLRKGRLYDKLYEKNKVPENEKIAEQTLRLANKLYPNDSEVLMYIGRHLIATKKSHEGIEFLTQCIAIDSTNSNNYFLRGIGYQQIKKYREAISNLSKAIDIEPQNIKYLYLSGELNFELKQFDSSILYAEKILKINPQNIDALNLIGNSYFEQNENTKALKFFNRGIESKDTNKTAVSYCYKNRSRIHLRNKNIEKALEDINVAISFNENAGNYSQRASLYVKMDDFTQALNDFSKAITLNPLDPERYLARANFYYDFAEYDLAIIDYRKMTKLDKSEKRGIISIGNAYRSKGNLDSALIQYTKCIGIGLHGYLNHSDSLYRSFAYQQRGEVYFDKKLIDEALRDFNNSIIIAPTNYKAYKYFRRGHTYVSIYKYEKALDDFNSAIKLEPNIPDYVHDRGVLFYSVFEDLNSAMDDFEKVTLLTKEKGGRPFISAVNYLGLIYESKNEFDLALEANKKGMQLKHIDPEAAYYCFRNSAAINISLQRYNNALLDLNGAIECKPKYDEGYLKRGIFYSSYKNRHDLALSDFTRAIELDPNDPKNWHARGQLYKRKLGIIQPAISDFKKAIEIDPSLIEASMDLSIYYEEIGDLKNAKSTLDQAILTSENIESRALCRVLLAALLVNENEEEKAMYQILKTIDIESENPFWIEKRAKIYLSLGHLEKSLVDYNKCIELDPSNMEYYLSRAYVYYSLNNFKKAEFDYNYCVKAFPKNTHYLNQRAVFFGLIDNYNKALRDYKTILKIDPNNISAFFNRSKLYLKNNYIENAQIDCSKSLTLDENDPEGYYYLGVVNEIQGKYNKALKFYNFAAAKVGGEIGYYVSKEDGSVLPNSSIYIKLAELYLKADEKEMACEDYQKALELMKDEPYYMKKEEDQKALEEKIKTLCN